MKEKWQEITKKLSDLEITKKPLKDERITLSQQLRSIDTSKAPILEKIATLKASLIKIETSKAPIKERLIQIDAALSLVDDQKRTLGLELAALNKELGELKSTTPGKREQNRIDKEKRIVDVITNRALTVQPGILRTTCIGAVYGELRLPQTLIAEVLDKFDKKLWYQYQGKIYPIGPIKSLSCSCCGSSVRGRQWWNRDTGYGLCNTCIEVCKRGENDTAFESLFGIRGVHYDVDMV